MANTSPRQKTTPETRDYATTLQPPPMYRRGQRTGALGCFVCAVVAAVLILITVIANNL